MNERVRFLKEDLFRKKRRISLERALLYIESDQETQNEPTIIKRARATEKILDHVKISIREKELIVGNRTVRPRSGIVSPEMDPNWILEELDTIANRPQDPFEITEEDKKIYREVIYPYWKNRSMKDYIFQNISPEIKKAIDDGIFTLNQTDKGQGHIIMDFPVILNTGIQALIEKLDQKITEYPENHFYRAAKIVFKATQRHILRYAELAESNAADEKTVQRKEELLNISRICRKIAYEKPETFYEACQLLWFISLVAQYESNASSISLGRFDQYMYPFYRRDIERGVPREKQLEILECFFIKTNDVVLVRSQESARYFAGFPTGYTITLGGLTERGRSAVNELSYLCLDAFHDVRLPQPNLSVRVNELIPGRFLKKTAETIRLGTGMPQLFNDEVIVPGLLTKGVSLEDARDYAIVGCVEITVPGKTYGLHDIAIVNLFKLMELTILEQKNNPHITYAEIIARLKQKISHYVKLVTEGSDIVDLGHRYFAPTPFISVLIDGCLESGKDVTEGGAKYNFSGVQGIGEANLSDSLYALKKVVFEEKRIRFNQLVEAMENNFGTEEQEELRIRLINKYEKYGNDVDEVDDIGAEILRHFAKELGKYTNVRGGSFTPGAYTVSAHIPLGEVVGATPDGRKAHEQLADGGLSPMVGRDQLGPTAVLKSVSKFDNYLTVNGSLLNLKFNPQTLKGEAGIKKFCDFIRAFMRLKIQHIQFNVISRDILLEAQKHPEKYKGLVVRVAGYSAFFVELNKKIQDDIIARTEHLL